MQINSNLNANAGPSSKMQQPQLQPAKDSYKTPSMAFLENKRREEEKHLQQHHNYPQSADFKKFVTPISPNNNSSGNPDAVAGTSLAQNQQSSFSMRKLEQQKLKKGPASVTDDDKIAMWLPSFSPMPEAAGSQLPSTANRKADFLQSPIITLSKEPLPRLQGKQMS